LRVGSPPGPVGRQSSRLNTSRSICYLVRMANREPFKIDINDPAEIEGALKEADERVTTLTSQLNETMTQLRHWQVLYQRLAMLSGQSVNKPASGGGSVRSRVEKIVNDSKTPVDAEWVLQLIPDAQRKTVNWNLWDLERKGKIQKVTDGVYARLDFKADKPTTLLDGDK
jgi:hypothetical protein